MLSLLEGPPSPRLIEQVRLGVPSQDAICSQTFSVETISSPIMIWKLIINYKSPADSLGFFLTSSYNFN